MNFSDADCCNIPTVVVPNVLASLKMSLLGLKIGILLLSSESAEIDFAVVTLIRLEFVTFSVATLVNSGVLVT